MQLGVWNSACPLLSAEDFEFCGVKLESDKYDKLGVQDVIDDVVECGSMTSS